MSRELFSLFRHSVLIGWVALVILYCLDDSSREQIKVYSLLDIYIVLMALDQMGKQQSL